MPEKAQKGAQWLVAAFLAEHRRQRQGRASNAAEFYAKEAERMRTHVAQLESKLADFKRANYGQLPELTEVNMSMMDRTESAARAERHAGARRCARNACSSPRSSSSSARAGSGRRQRAAARRPVRAHALDL